MSAETGTNLDASLEADLFWEKHKSKIFACAGIFLAALVGWGGFQYAAHSKDQAAKTALAAARDEAGYQAVVRDFAGTAAAGDALLLMSKLQREGGRYDDAVATLQQFLDAYQDHPFAGGARLALALTYEAQDKTAEAAAQFADVTGRDGATYAAPVAALYQAVKLEREGKRDEARVAIENLIAQYPDSIVLEEAKARLQMMRR